MEFARFTVRRASAEDAALLADLGARTFRDTFAAQNSESDMAAYLANAFGDDIQARELAETSSAFFIALTEGGAAGYARLRRGPAPACVSARRPAEIVRFYADAPWIGHGVGGALMKACFGEAVSYDSDVVWLDVWERNLRAIAFYAKWGFKIDSPEEVVWMRKRQ